MAKRAERTRRQGPSTPGRLRIVAGIWRSRILEIADVKGLRPTSERIRETLFNWLTAEIAGTRCLDLFAGTGALGLEALSRGAREVVFVEKDRRAAAALERNAETLNATGATIRHCDALDYVATASEGPFDVMFLDPPFADAGVDNLCRLIDDSRLLAPGGRVYIEQPRERELVELPEGWRLIKSKTAGNVRYSLAQAHDEKE